MDKINLLMVDDEEQFLTSMSKRLEARGFHVMAVNRGEKALEMARTHPVDIALVDLKMPGMNGEETLKSLKQEHAWIEIVMLTGHGSIDSVVECNVGGAHSYLHKPCDLEQIMEVLKEAYKKRVMNRHQMEETKMAELLKDVNPDSPREILRRLKEIDEGVLVG
jgi:DNA-binding NtrC family response regulator